MDGSGWGTRCCSVVLRHLSISLYPAKFTRWGFHLVYLGHYYKIDKIDISYHEPDNLVDDQAVS